MSAPTRQQASWPYPLPGSGRDVVSEELALLDPEIFREYDVRGTVTSTRDGPAPMNEGVTARIGKAFGTLMARRGLARVAVGFDSRSYSRRLADALMTGLLSTGADVINIGLSTTPVLYLAQHHLGGTAGVAVTASHNPNGWAGLKIGYEPSETMVGRDRRAPRCCHVSEFPLLERQLPRESSVLDAYVTDVVARVPQTKAIDVVIDGANSVAGPIAELVLKAAGHNVTTINRELDWDFPNHDRILRQSRPAIRSARRY